MSQQKGVFRLAISMILLLGLFGLVADAQETQQQVERLIKQLQDQDPEVRAAAAITLGQIEKGGVDP
ncbi:MAG: HEAT repeat domain-containing protein, partial [Candidatus Poribacteria bacterium]|nr:HEAT repeat domain-containing protein [Candidatus Poribacteria bacterium]